MTNHIVKAAVFAAAVGAFSVTAGTADAKLKRITVGTNPQGSVYFLLGSGFAKLLQEKMGVRANAQPHAGSSVYLPLMEAGEITLGLNSSLDSGLAFGGKAPYKKATKNVRSIARVWILPYAYMVKESSGIKTLADLKGKRVVVKFKTNVSLAQANRTILSSAGLTTKDVTPVESGGVVASIGMVVQGRVDAAPIATGMPALRMHCDYVRLRRVFRIDALARLHLRQSPDPVAVDRGLLKIHGFGGGLHLLSQLRLHLGRTPFKKARGVSDETLVGLLTNQPSARGRAALDLMQ